MNAILSNNFVRVATLVLVIQAALFYSASRGEYIPVAAPLSAFPTEVGGWRLAQEGVIEKDELDVLKADDTMTRLYSSGEGVANLFIAYFKTQRAGQSPHSPKNCLPGSGWQPSENDRIDVPVNGSSIHINRYVVSKGGAQDVVLYWYQSHGRVVADEFAAKFYLVSDSIREHRSDTSLVRVVVPVNGNNTAQAEQVATNFVKAFYPAVAGYLPK